MKNEQQIAEVKDTDLVIFGENGRPTTTSLVMAERFEKLHKNIIQKIETLDCSDSFRKLNFQPTEKVTKIGVTTRTIPVYEITRDGFTFLAMGFTGKNAAIFKERFIAAFNKMEWALMMKKQSAPAQNTGISVDALSKVLVDVSTNMIDRFDSVLKTVLDGHAKTIDSLLKHQGKDTAETKTILESTTKTPGHAVGDIWKKLRTSLTMQILRVNHTGLEMPLPKKPK